MVDGVYWASGAAASNNKKTQRAKRPATRNARGGPTKPISDLYPRVVNQDRVTEGFGVMGLRKHCVSKHFLLLLLLQLPLLRESCAF